MNTPRPPKPAGTHSRNGSIASLFKALIDSRTPLYAKLLPIVVFLYAIIPFDVIPDIIPFAGWIDDLVIMPAGMWMAMKYIPQEVLAETGAELSITIAKFKRKILLFGLALVAICMAISTVTVLFIVWVIHRT